MNKSVTNPESHFHFLGDKNHPSGAIELEEYRRRNLRGQGASMKRLAIFIAWALIGGLLNALLIVGRCSCTVGFLVGAIFVSSYIVTCHVSRNESELERIVRQKVRQLLNE
jgi:hypothetical protein